MPDYDEIEYEDFPLQGPRTMFRDLRQPRRLGMSFIQHHKSWLRKSGLRSTDRSIYEHSTLCPWLDFMASYHQLNLPALASAEALNRRRALIEIARQGRPDAPSYEAAEEGVSGWQRRGPGTYAAKRQAAKAEVLKQTRLAAEERKHAHRAIFREPDARHGDLFPLPAPCDIGGYAGNLGSLGSWRARQQVQKRRLLEDRQRGAEGEGDSCTEAPAPTELSRAALRQLLLKKAGSPYSCAGVLPGQVASYVRERVPLPRDQSELRTSPAGDPAAGGKA